MRNELEIDETVIPLHESTIKNQEENVIKEPEKKWYNTLQMRHFFNSLKNQKRPSNHRGGRMNSAGYASVERYKIKNESEKSKLIRNTEIENILSGRKSLPERYK